MTTTASRPKPTPTATGAERHPRKAAKGGREGRRIFSYIFLAVLVVYFLFPLWWLVVASTKDNAGLFAGTSGALWFDDNFALFSNIAGLATYDGGIYWRWVLNAFIYAVVGGFGATALAVLAGYGFAKFEFRGRYLYLATVLGAVMVPTTALVIPLFVMFSDAGLTNTMWSVILPSLLSPFGAYLMYVFCKDSLADEILDAGRVDGAGDARLFFTIALPLLRPAVVTVLLLSVVHTWNQFFLPFVMLTDTALLPVTVGLNHWQMMAAGSNGIIQPWNYIVTGSFISVLPLIAAFLSLQRYWQGGLSLGSVKS